MTEAEWTACINPAPMLEFLRGRTSSRKLRLFGCAACRRIWRLLPEPSREAVEAAERYADCLTITDQLQSVRSAAYDVWHSALTSTCIGPLIQAEEAAARAAFRLTDDIVEETSSADAIIEVADSAVDAVAYANVADLAEESFSPGEIASPIHDAIRQVEWAKQSVLLRDIMGNPFRHTAVDPSWLEWNDDRIVKEAQAIYDQRVFHRLAVLEDLLKSAGCKDESVLKHCTRLGKHVLGCWLVDLLLGKD